MVKSPTENETEPLSLADKFLRWGIIAVLIMVPFHGFLTVWLSSIFGHYQLLRLWDEFLLLGLSGLAFYMFLGDSELRRRLLGNWVVRISLVFLLIVMLMSLIPFIQGTVSPKAIGYGLIVDTRPVVFLLVVMVAILRKNNIAWARVVVGPALIVASFALLQFFVLPHNFLAHFGYGTTTIKVFQPIDSTVGGTSSSVVRAQSFTRGPNALGAYLVPVLTLLVLGCVHFKTKRRFGLAIAVVGAAIIVSFSRSAILGALISVGVLLAWTVQRRSARRLFWWIGFAVITVSIVSVLALRNVVFVQNLIFHTSDSSRASASPNSLRVLAIDHALQEIVRHPLGVGVGSAGPASLYNLQHPPEVAENYFLQIGQETGVLGLAAFIALLTLIIMRLWGRRAHGLSRAVLASLLGIIWINMVSHAWADDTLAYVSWGLIAAGMTVKVTKDVQAKQPKRSKNKNNTKTEKPATIAA